MWICTTCKTSRPKPFRQIMAKEYLMRVIFSVSNSLQNQNCENVVDRMRRQNIVVQFLDMNTMKLCDAPPVFDAHRNRLSIWILLLSIRFRFSSSDALVLQQDYGIQQRILAKSAKRNEAKLIIIPDGLIYDFNLIGRNSVNERVKRLVAIFLSWLEVSEGSTRNWFQTNPDLILSWGSKWEDSIRRMAPASKIEIVGCPRFDKYPEYGISARGSGILFLSTPMYLLNFVETEVFAYYENLEKFLSETQDSGVRLRLHPEELASPLIPPSLKKQSSSNSLMDDILLVDLVLSPMSTALLEAVALHKRICLFNYMNRMGEYWNANTFLSDSNIPQVSNFNEISLETVADSREYLSGIRDGYLANLGSAAAAVSDSIVEYLD